MQSQAPETALPLPYLRAIPKSSRWRLPFWPHPVPAGFYGRRWTNILWITSNNAKNLSEMVDQADIKDGVILALDAGGLSPVAAAAFGRLRAEQALTLLDKIPSGLPIITVRITRSVARSMGWTDQDQIHSLNLQIAGDKPDHKLNLSPVFSRLWTAMLLFIGQALLFAIPLAIFGQMALMLGLGTMLVSGFILALLWPITPGTSLLKGVIVGLCLSILWILVGLYWGGLNATTLLNVALGICLASIWMSAVFQGIRNT